MRWEIFYYIFWKSLYRTIIIYYLNAWGNSPVKSSAPKVFFVGKFLSYKLIFVIAIGLFRLLISSRICLDCLYILRNFSICPSHQLSFISIKLLIRFPYHFHICIVIYFCTTNYHKLIIYYFTTSLVQESGHIFAGSWTFHRL